MAHINFEKLEQTFIKRLKENEELAEDYIFISALEEALLALVEISCDDYEKLSTTIRQDIINTNLS